MFLLKSALRSLLGGGLKTWLTVFILSVAFVFIVFLAGIVEGWKKQAYTDTINWEVSGGQYWSNAYDPFDPFTLDSAVTEIPASLKQAYNTHQIEPILIIQGTIYPHGRMMPVMMKGIRPDQTLLELPAKKMEVDTAEISAMIGTYMAKQTNLNVNDMVTLRWRDSNGTFEAMDIRISHIFKTPIPTTDNGTIWLPLGDLQKMTLQPDKATIIVKSPELEVKQVAGWKFNDVKELTKDLKAMLDAQNVESSIYYLIFIVLAMLAIFDTQTLSVFRRQREIGTFVALGMTQKQVQGLFTLEGTMNAFLAMIAGAVYGIPLCAFYAKNGIPMPEDSSQFGVAIADKIYPVFTVQMILSVIVFMFIVTAIVSYLPARKIAKMNPTDAIRGKVL